ncbi:coat protein [Sclerotinia nivalis victorivirus 1]|uniref:Coat protein n=1 Tax=Sclerotinia nivalis victorivirus 1 TaxID=1859161 RepID=A0A192ABA0_9VIRU|nr:coat protein [Sclerotinia nivalis victorivirus 1]ANJ77667.1 coat protein [Sclerotinia nivalis victorivirus 1]
MTTVIRNSFLASVLASPRGGYIENDNTYRRYKSNVRTSSTIGGNEDSRLVQILYEVGRSKNSKGRALARPGEDDPLIEAGYPTANALAEDFVGLSKKFTNFSATFEFSSHAAIVERLARGLAASSIFDDVDSSDLRAGRTLVINALGTYDGPVNSLTSSVFIPRLVNSAITGDVFSVLANAAAGEGAEIATDIIELDALTRQPIVPEVEATALSRAIVDALRILGANMIACDQGPLFALALTRGLHKVLTVVGHTDEGAVSRDLLRCGSFSVPFGDIHYGLEPYAGIPALSTNSSYGRAAYVDSLALSTAALVAHCDPGQIYDGRWLPTFFSGSSSTDTDGRPGDSLDPTDAMTLRNRAQLLSDLPKFSLSYIPALAKLFAAEGNPAIAIAAFNGASSQLSRTTRHLKFASVSPWFWIEPTSLIPHDFVGSVAEHEGFASYGGRDSTRSRHAWEDIQASGVNDTAFSAYHALFRGARACWFFLHWLGNPANGLGSISVRQLDPNAIIHPGPCTAHQQVRDRVEASLPWTDYLWTRGQSPFPAPGEMLNISGTVGFFVKHYTFDDEGLPTVEHVPASHEFLDTTVTLHVGRPIGLSIGASNTPASDARRARTRATRELAAASARAAVFGRPDVSEMPTLTTAPVLRSRNPTLPTHITPNDTPGGTDVTHRSRHQGVGGADASDRLPAGEPRIPVPQHQPVRYPQVPRPAGNQPGGGGPGIPPAPPGPGGPNGDDDDNDPPAPVNPPEGGPPTPPAGAAPPNGPAPI